MYKIPGVSGHGVGNQLLYVGGIHSASVPHPFCQDRPALHSNPKYGTRRGGTESVPLQQQSELSRALAAPQRVSMSGTLGQLDPLEGGHNSHLLVNHQGASWKPGLSPQQPPRQVSPPHDGFKLAFLRS